MKNRSNISYVLEQAILDALKNPPQPTTNIEIREEVDELPDIDAEATNEQPLDFLAYHDAMAFIYESFESLEGNLACFSQDNLLTQDLISKTPNNIYNFNQNHLIEPPGVDDELIIVNHEQIVLTRSIAPNAIGSVDRLMGSNNFSSTQKRLFQDKPAILVLPFEMTTLVNPSKIKGISPQDAFKQNPLHPCFTHLLSPAPVMGIALEQNLSQLIGYVVHVKMLYNLLNNGGMIEGSDAGISLKNHIALQFDSQSALRMLNYRYRIDVDRDVIDRITEFDEQIKKHSETGCCIEIQ